MCKSKTYKVWDLVQAEEAVKAAQDGDVIECSKEELAIHVLRELEEDSQVMVTVGGL